ncbi:MAG: hypothetical protein ACOX1Y_06910 [Zhaonellaceae bacterium]|jgi:hypothetical protein
MSAGIWNKIRSSSKVKNYKGLKQGLTETRPFTKDLANNLKIFEEIFERCNKN